MALPLKKEAEIVVPASILRKAGIGPQAKLQFKASKGVITITDRTRDDDGFTAQQRAQLLRDLREARKEIDRGNFYGPFNTVEEMKASIEAEFRKRRAGKRRKG